MKADFYHLQKQTLEEALPRLLEKAYESGKKIKVKVGNEDRVEFINAWLWTYSDFSFLPHGSKKDGNAALQPIWLTADKDNPHNAAFLFLVDGAKADFDELKAYERVFDIFDGNAPEAVGLARELWKLLRDNAVEAAYWQQEPSGWVKRQ